MSVLWRTVCAAAVVVAANAGSFAWAQDAEVPLPPVEVTTSPQSKTPKKSAAKKKPKTQVSAPSTVAAPPPVAPITASGASPLPPSDAGSVTASGNAVNAAAENAATARAQAPNGVMIMEGAQLQQYSHLSIGDVMRRLPGVTFPGVNRSRDIKLRGIDKAYTQVLLDGRPLLDGDTSRNMEVDRIPASFIERIEITRTPLANMESQGAAGTVNIITRRSFGPSGGQLTLGAGRMPNNGSPGEINAWQGGEAGAVRYFIAGGYQRRLVQESSSELSYSTNGTTPDRGQFSPQHRKFDEYTFLSRFEWDINPANTIIVAPSYMKTTEQREQNAYRLDKNQKYVDRDTKESRERIREAYGVATEWLHDFGNATNARTYFEYQRGREDTSRHTVRTEFNSNGTIKSGPTVQPPRFVPIDVERIAAGSAIKSRIGQHTVEAGVGWAQRMHDENAIIGFVPAAVPERTYQVTEDIYHAYISDSFSLFGNDLLTVGLRMEHSITETINDQRLQNDVSATDFNPSLSYRLSAAENLDFRLGIARTLRRPDLSELTPTVVLEDGTFVSPDKRGNPDTTPEKIWGLDVGTDYYFFGRNGLLAANFFARSFEDKIENAVEFDATTNRWMQTPRNAGDGHLYGAELEARLPMAFIGLTDLTLWGNATAMKSELTDSVTGQTRRFANQPGLLTNIGVDYYVPMWATTFGLGYNRTYAYDQDILQTNGNYQHTSFSALDRLDASARISLEENVVLSVTASNLLRADDIRTVTTRNGAGAITALTTSREPSPSVFYSRLSLGW
ncbi:TonB-dependent receptor domain-containing protein [Hyphomicrobium sulfonivorans]|uniref:TonB-dependent receptor domain-containing protein n=1 Tax=Hyphomicrobium sulfonivorans TaxID=121290 RepID=UPI00156DF8E9|nr:TonB-dependent receptor [Hyphomicrobium sulfonivorans]